MSAAPGGRLTIEQVRICPVRASRASSACNVPRAPLSFLFTGTRSANLSAAPSYFVSFVRRSRLFNSTMGSAQAVMYLVFPILPGPLLLESVYHVRDTSAWMVQEEVRAFLSKVRPMDNQRQRPLRGFRLCGGGADTYAAGSTNSARNPPIGASPKLRLPP
jgi:hypothetical protein